MLRVTVPPMNQPAESYRPPPHPRGGPVPEKEFAMSDKLAFFQLPPLLQSELAYRSSSLLRVTDPTCLHQHFRYVNKSR